MAHGAVDIHVVSSRRLSCLSLNTTQMEPTSTLTLVKSLMATESDPRKKIESLFPPSEMALAAAAVAAVAVRRGRFRRDLPAAKAAHGCVGVPSLFLRRRRPLSDSIVDIARSTSLVDTDPDAKVTLTRSLSVVFLVRSPRLLLLSSLARPRPLCVDRLWLLHVRSCGESGEAEQSPQISCCQ
jgi:hypothetical protein